MGARPRGKGGKIPPETEPTKKRKRENIEDGKKSGENGERKVRRKSEGGSEEGEEWGGRILNSEETEKERKVGGVTGVISKFVKNTEPQTELNNCDNSQDIYTVRHGTHSAREKKVEILKRKIICRKVQEKKGEGVTRGHFGPENDVEPEKRKMVQENLTGGARSTESEKKDQNRPKTTKTDQKNKSKIFKGVKFGGSKKGN